MSFFKALILAIVATLFLTYVFGTSILEIFDIDIYMHDELVEPLKTISFTALFAVLLVLAVLAIILTVFGSIIFVGLLVVGSLCLVAIGVFWPVLLVTFMLWLVLKENPQKSTDSNIYDH